MEDMNTKTEKTRKREMFRRHYQAKSLDIESLFIREEKPSLNQHEKIKRTPPLTMILIRKNCFSQNF